MRVARGLLVLLPLILLGCGEGTQPRPSAKEEKGGLSKLSPEDRKLAEEQKYCAVESDNRLGAMDTPYKVIIEGQPVFLCCKNCEKKARAHPEKTLARVKELKEKAAHPENTEDAAK